MPSYLKDNKITRIPALCLYLHYTFSQASVKILGNDYSIAIVDRIFISFKKPLFLFRTSKYGS